MTEIRGVLLDFAGTVVMPQAAPVWVANAAASIGVDLSHQDIAQLADRYLQAGLPGGPYPADVPAHVADMYAVRDLGPDEHRKAYLALLGTVPEPAPGFTQAMYEQVLAPEGWVPYPDAAATVQALHHAGVRVGLISNIGYDLRAILRAHGLDLLAQRATISSEHRIMKPDVRLFEAALHTLGTPAEQTLMVGDSPSADTGGVSLGLRTLVLPMSPPGERHGLDLVTRLAGAAETTPPRRR